MVKIIYARINTSMELQFQYHNSIDIKSRVKTHIFVADTSVTKLLGVFRLFTARTYLGGRGSGNITRVYVVVHQTHRHTWCSHWTSINGTLGYYKLQPGLSYKLFSHTPGNGSLPELSFFADSRSQLMPWV